ncbi:MAG TPA: aminopeptidase P family N-terminal domain-containing protein, partial [Candidatus Angelobacter sp.]
MPESTPKPFTRRSFLQTSALATTGLLVSSESALAAQADATKFVPAPIARLQSRKSEAIPISTVEREQRLEKARRLMTDNKLDAIMLIGGTSLVYFTNIHWWLSERLFALILPAKGNPFYVCPAFEEDRAREQIATGPGGNNPEIRLWEEDESPYQRIAQGLKERGITGGRLGMEETVRFV